MAGITKSRARMAILLSHCKGIQVCPSTPRRTSHCIMAQFRQREAVWPTRLRMTTSSGSTQPIHLQAEAELLELSLLVRRVDAPLIISLHRRRELWSWQRTAWTRLMKFWLRTRNTSCRRRKQVHCSKMISRPCKLVSKDQLKSSLVAKKVLNSWWRVVQL